MTLPPLQERTAPARWRMLSLASMLIFVCAVGGCGMLVPDINEPEIVWKLHRDPRRITAWTLAQTDGAQVERGIAGLLYLPGMHPETAPAVASGCLEIDRRLASAWPGLTEGRPEDLRWWMRRVLERMASDGAPQPVVEAAAQLGPAGPRPAGYGGDDSRDAN